MIRLLYDNLKAAILASVRAVPVGRPGDAVDDRLFGDRRGLQRSRQEALRELQDAREAWRVNPMARRIVGLVTSYVIGYGLKLSSLNEGFAAFIAEFWTYPSNRMDQRCDEMCEELSRSGELFVALHLNPDNGMSVIRIVPAQLIDMIKTREGDYESELEFHESPEIGKDAVVWKSPLGATSADGVMDHTIPWMLHYAINRPPGALRGESDLGSILPWLRRYNGWLEDRVRLNAAVRAFLWIINAPQSLHKDLREKYRKPPEPGSVVISTEHEKWSVVAPSLNARDAQSDGQAIRWMVAAGGPGTALTDFGESDDANLATARATGELRRRFLFRRQSFFCWMLTDILTYAYNRSNDAMMTPMEAVVTGDVVVSRPDISVEDNEIIASALLDLTGSMMKVSQVMGNTRELRSVLLRLYLRFAEESLTDEEFEKVVAEGMMEMGDGSGMEGSESGMEGENDDAQSDS